MVRIINTSGIGGSESDFSSVLAVIAVNTSGQYEPNLFGGSSSGGNVFGPSSSIDEAVVRFDGTTGKIIQGQPTIFINDGGDFYCTSGTQFNFIATPASAFQVTADNNINLTSNLHNISLNAAENAGVAGVIDVNINASTGNSTISAGTNINLNTVAGNIGISSFADTNINSNGAFNVTGDPVNISVSPSFPNTYLNLINDQVTLSADGIFNLASLANDIIISTPLGNIDVSTKNILPANSGIIGIGSLNLPFSGVYAVNFVTQSPNGNYWKLAVSNAGIVTGVPYP